MTGECELRSRQEPSPNTPLLLCGGQRTGFGAGAFLPLSYQPLSIAGAGTAGSTGWRRLEQAGEWEALQWQREAGEKHKSSSVSRTGRSMGEEAAVGKA